MRMTTDAHLAMHRMLNDVKITKYVTHDDHNELIAVDEDGNRMEIKFYPAEQEQKVESKITRDPYRK